MVEFIIFPRVAALSDCKEPYAGFEPGLLRKFPTIASITSRCIYNIYFIFLLFISFKVTHTLIINLVVFVFRILFTVSFVNSHFLSVFDFIFDCFGDGFFFFFAVI